ncbi:MAG: hypothetical protein RLT87_07410 [Gammaproteobacteria bacterium]
MSRELVFDLPYTFDELKIITNEDISSEQLSQAVRVLKEYMFDFEIIKCWNSDRYTKAMFNFDSTPYIDPSRQWIEESVRHRWLCKGPNGKNPYFERWVCAFAKHLYESDVSLKPRSVNEKLYYLMCITDEIKYEDPKESATIKGLNAYQQEVQSANKCLNLAASQIKILNSIFRKRWNQRPKKYDVLAHQDSVTKSKEIHSDCS